MIHIEPPTFQRCGKVYVRGTIKDVGFLISTCWGCSSLSRGLLWSFSKLFINFTFVESSCRPVYVENPFGEDEDCCWILMKVEECWWTCREFEHKRVCVGLWVKSAKVRNMKNIYTRYLASKSTTFKEIGNIKIN